MYNYLKHYKPEEYTLFDDNWKLNYNLITNVYSLWYTDNGGPFVQYSVINTSTISTRHYATTSESSTAHIKRSGDVELFWKTQDSRRLRFKIDLPGLQHTVLKKKVECKINFVDTGIMVKRIDTGEVSLYDLISIKSHYYTSDLLKLWSTAGNKFDIESPLEPIYVRDNYFAAGIYYFPRPSNSFTC
jgi:hypothetical protein